jgi:hypothetical protein
MHSLRRWRLQPVVSVTPRVTTPSPLPFLSLQGNVFLKGKLDEVRWVHVCTPNRDC